MIQPGELIYENALSSAEDVSGFRMEGEAVIGFPEGRSAIVQVLPSSSVAPLC